MFPNFTFDIDFEDKPCFCHSNTDNLVSTFKPCSTFTITPTDRLMQCTVNICCTKRPGPYQYFCPTLASCHQP